jgi:hypothetical protein
MLIMADINATILIPDISGFTAFMTTTELTHSSKAINMLIDAIVHAVGEEYELAEVEGDAVLLIKKGPAPSQKEILDICLNIFKAFHFQRKSMQQYTVCPCNACQEINNLTLKFVVHYGPLSEIKVGRFVKLSGVEMIVAHRLLKNSIDNNEYLLVTEKLLQQAAASAETEQMEWSRSSEAYASIGQVDYRFTLLQEARKNVPEPLAAQSYRTDDTPYLQTQIAANYRDVYMAMMDIPGRSAWMPDLQKVEQDTPDVFIGSVHYCTFDDFQAIVSPLQMTVSADGILYAESCRIKEMGVSLVHEFVFKNIDENVCGLATRLMNAGEAPLPEDIKARLSEKMQLLAESLKAYCEKSGGAADPSYN